MFISTPDVYCKNKEIGLAVPTLLDGTVYQYYYHYHFTINQIHVSNIIQCLFKCNNLAQQKTFFAVFVIASNPQVRVDLWKRIMCGIGQRLYRCLSILYQGQALTPSHHRLQFQDPTVQGCSLSLSTVSSLLKSPWTQHRRWLSISSHSERLYLLL